MANGLQIERLYSFRSHRLLCFTGVLAILVVLPLFLVFPYQDYISSLTDSSTTVSSKSQSASARIVQLEENDSRASYGKNETFYDREQKEDVEDIDSYLEDRGGYNKFTSEKGLRTDRVSKTDLNYNKTLHEEEDLETGLELTKQAMKLDIDASKGIAVNANVNMINENDRRVAGFASLGTLTRNLDFIAEVSDVGISMSSEGKKDLKRPPKNTRNETLQASSLLTRDISTIASKSVPKRNRRRPTSISDMNALIRQGSQSVNSVVYDLKFNSVPRMRINSIF